MTAPPAIRDLVKRYSDNTADYSVSTYKEAQVRKEFIDPFFKALGWDVDNAEGYAEAYKDVVHEDAIKVGGPRQGARLLIPLRGTCRFSLRRRSHR